jgi:hypothetical protein
LKGLYRRRGESAVEAEMGWCCARTGTLDCEKAFSAAFLHASFTNGHVIFR